MPKPPTYDELVPGWPLEKRWQDLRNHQDCSVKPEAAQLIDLQGCDTFYNSSLGKYQTDCSQKPVLEAALDTAGDWCWQYIEWRTSPEAAQELLGEQYGIDEEFATQLVNTSKAAVGPNITDDMWKVVKTFWKPATMKAWQTTLEFSPNLLPFIPIWNRLQPSMRDWFCIFRPWVPIATYAQEVAHKKKMAVLKADAVVAKTGLPKGAIQIKQGWTRASRSTDMIMPFCVKPQAIEAGQSILAAVQATQAETLEGTQEALEQKDAILREEAERGHQHRVEQFLATCTPGDVQYFKGVKYTCEEAAALVTEEVEETPAPVEEAKPNILPWVLGGLGLVAGGPVGGIAGFAAGAALGKKSETYVGQAFELEEPPAEMFEGVPKEKHAALRREYECAQVAGYLWERDYPAVGKAMLGLEHNNAEYLAEYGQLPVKWRTGVNLCAQFFGKEKVSAAWNSMSKEERGEHLKYVRSELARVTAGKPGTSIVCSPAISMEECKDRLEKAIDEHTCKGISIPLGAPGLNACVSYQMLSGAALGLGVLAKNKWVVGAGLAGLLFFGTKKKG